MEDLETIVELEALQIKPEDDIPPHRFLFRWNTTPCFARGELVAVGGKAKSGKTYLSSLLMSLCSQQSQLILSRDGDEPLHALWIDTEQSEDTTHEILTKRIADPSVVTVYNLRTKAWRERMELVSNAILLHSDADLVIFDGIRDVVGDINDYTMAQEVVDKMLSLASFTNACIVCVLHQNKSAEDKTLRGALGTELMNKCFEAYECKKDEDTLVFSVSQQLTRKFDVSGKLTFTVDKNGLPKACESNLLSDTTRVRSYNPYQFNEKYLREDNSGRLNLKALMTFAMRGKSVLRTEQLVDIIRKEANIKSYALAEKIVRDAANEKIIEPVGQLGQGVFRLHEMNLFDFQQDTQ